ncbi:MAG: hypothetical protein KKA55_12740 [Proteobacteria bacterium]|nr:hypothetical protein [Pseudomonadota bacterium]MBU1596385.1 hypothetical protein [Pseudomonadota bacterium]
MDDNNGALVPVAEPEAKPGLLGTFTLGLKVWALEMRRILTGQAKRHEVRQLEARLREEMAVLARLDASGRATPDPERGLCLTQIESLKAEIARLRREEEATEPR